MSFLLLTMLTYSEIKNYDTFHVSSTIYSCCILLR